jgi:hypothetical protein
MDVDDIKVPDPKDRLLGYMVGTADLIGRCQTACTSRNAASSSTRSSCSGRSRARTLPDGREIVRYSSPEDLIYKTPGFYEYVARDRINRKLGAPTAGPRRTSTGRPLPERDRQQHELPARGHRKRGTEPAAPHLLLALEENQQSRLILWGLSHPAE